MDYAGYNQDPSLSTLSKKNHHFASMRCVTFIILPTVIADAQHSRHPPRECSEPSLLPLHASRHKKKKISQYLHVLPVIYDGGFSKWLAPRYVLLSLAMLWNQLNYITT